VVFFLYGKDSFRRDRFLRELVAPYRAKYADWDLKTFDLEDKPEEWRAARDFLNQPSMFVASKVAIVKGGTAVDEKEWVKTLKNQIAAPKNFVFISETGSPPKKFNFLLEKPARFQEFKELTGADLAEFVESELKAHGVSFEPAAFRFFLDYIDSAEEKSARAASEIEKISLLNLKQPISLEDLRNVVVWRAAARAWVLAREILREKNFKNRLGTLESLLFEEDAAYVFNSLGFQASGRAAAALADYDISIKSGGLEYEEALLSFVLD